MKILAIETSCDETAVAILDINGPLENPNIAVLGNTLLSQAVLHAKYGGVYPNLAKREHQKNLPPLLNETLSEAKLKISDVDYIAVTHGPGLEPALWTGITFAEKLGLEWQKPVVPINHMEGHIWSVLYRDKFSISNSSLDLARGEQFPKLELPALALLVSGGHTELVLVKNFGDYKILGQTRDDAVGEAFDKVARMLKLPYPGGPEISKLAEKNRVEETEPKITFPRPMIHSKDLDFSFSGLKTAVLYKIKSENKMDQKFRELIARAFEDAAIDVLVTKTHSALSQLEDEIKSLILAGGVSANTHLTKKLKGLISTKFPKINFYAPNRLLSTDNAIMIGIAAFIKINQRINTFVRKEEGTIRAEGNLTLTS